MYTSVATVKTILWITWTSADAVITVLCNDADSMIDALLDIDWFDSWTATETITYPRNSVMFRIPKFYLKNFNVTQITKVNNIAYTGVLNTDYKITNGRAVEIKNLSQYNVTTVFPSFDIEYKYWYARTPSDLLPSDIELMARLLVVGMYQRDYPMWYSTVSWWGVSIISSISTYKIWEEWIQYSENARSNLISLTANMSPDKRSQLQQLLAKYKKSNVVR